MMCTCISSQFFTTSELHPSQRDSCQCYRAWQLQRGERRIADDGTPADVCYVNALDCSWSCSRQYARRGKASMPGSKGEGDCGSNEAIHLSRSLGGRGLDREPWGGWNKLRIVSRRNSWNSDSLGDRGGPMKEGVTRRGAKTPLIPLLTEKAAVCVMHGRKSVSGSTMLSKPFMSDFLCETIWARQEALTNCPWTTRRMPIWRCRSWRRASEI